MSTKISMTKVVTKHYGTFKDAKTEQPLARDLLTQIGIPLAAAMLSVLAGFRLTGIAELIAAIAVLAALLFGMIIYVFQLRLQVAQDPRVEKGGYLTTLIDELYSNLSYAVLVGLVLTFLGIIAASVEIEDHGTSGAAWTAGLVLLLVHFVLTLLMCLKRLRRAYDRMTI